MKYEKEINESFKRLSLKPRENQISCINQVLEAFLDKAKPFVVLSAPTGTGKSIIGAVIADVINTISGTKLASIILMHNNALAKQYYQTFSNFGEHRYLNLKGANNYTCSALSGDTVEDLVTAENCAIKVFHKEHMSSIITQHCDKCEYLRLKSLKNISKNVITNFSYYFVDRQFANNFEIRDVVIWDEAHTLNDAFCEHNAIYFSKDRLKKFYEELAENLKLPDLEMFKILKKVQIDLEAKKINDNNYLDYLRLLQQVYNIAFSSAQEVAENCSYDMKMYTKYSKLAKKYFGLGCKIDDLFIYNYEHIFEFNEKTFEATVKPIFIGNMFSKALIHSDFNLFMSATISKEYIVETLNLNDDDVEFVKVPPTFPKENKKIVFFNTRPLNYVAMQDPKTIEMLCQNVANIVKIHGADFSENGIILTPSFAVAEQLGNFIRKVGIKVNMFEHMRGMKAENVINAFKGSSGPSLMISPSIYEGIDLPGDLSRYQIIVKAPYPSLAEKRMKYILDKHPAIYNSITIMKIVQGSGRSVRSVDDHATTYILDSNAKRLFSSKLNVWKDEFHVIFK